MIPVLDVQQQIEKIDLQIIKLLDDRANLYSDIRAYGDKSYDEETSALWIEEASDSGLDETIIEKICKLTMLLCKRREE